MNIALGWTANNFTLGKSSKNDYARTFPKSSCKLVVVIMIFVY